MEAIKADFPQFMSSTLKTCVTFFLKTSANTFKLYFLPTYQSS